MTAEPQDFEPEKLTAGVTWNWKKTHSDYPASEWTLNYYLRKDGATATKLYRNGRRRFVPSHRRRIDNEFLRSRRLQIHRFCYQGRREVHRVRWRS